MSTPAQTTLQQSGRSADENMSSDRPGSAVQSCDEEKTWIEIQLVGEDGQPIPNERYIILLPDGSSQEGTLDSNGIASVSEIDAGNCKISFQDLDKDAWEPI